MFLFKQLRLLLFHKKVIRALNVCVKEIIEAVEARRNLDKKNLIRRETK